MYLTCPQRHSNHVTKNGFNRLNKQLYKCQDCGRQFVLHPAKGAVSQETRELIDRLLLEKISLAGIARAVKVSEAWLQNYVADRRPVSPSAAHGASAPGRPPNAQRHLLGAVARGAWRDLPEHFSS
ncbi:MAG: IS1 family transposase [Marichromatium sp.]|nr:IS1 family transposase [Marichromatium sp.]